MIGKLFSAEFFDMQYIIVVTNEVHKVLSTWCARFSACVVLTLVLLLLASGRKSGLFCPHADVRLAMTIPNNVIKTRRCMGFP
ncbi:MAG: hypothetical protein ACJA2J_000817 [Candidatus Azotimanducaceae bacterium]